MGKKTILLILMVFILFGIISCKPKIQTVNEFDGFELTLDKTTRTIDANEVKGHFSQPIVYYFKHKDDILSIFYTFVLLDLENNTFTYFSSYNKENLEKLNDNKELDSIAKQSCDSPHNAVRIDDNKFYVFSYGKCNFFFLVDTASNKLKVITGKDLGVNNLIDFGDTFNTDNNSLYLSAIIERNDEYIVQYYESDLTLDKIDLLYEHSADLGLRSIPHSTFMIQNKILNAVFLGKAFELNGEEFNPEEMYNYVFLDVYNKLNIFQKLNIQIYREINKLKYTIAKRIKKISLHKNPYKNIWKSSINKKYGIPTISISEAVHKKYFEENFIEVLNNNYEYNLTKGQFNVYDIETANISVYNTSKPGTGHFFMLENNLYISSHGLDKVGTKVEMFTPGALDKFKLENGSLIYEGSFSDPNGYRYTTHRAFFFNNHEYLVTFGHPNLLIVVDAEDMSLSYKEIIGKDYFSQSDNILSIVNNDIPGEDIFRTLEVSDDGEFFVLFSMSNIYLYSFTEKKVIKKIENNIPMNISDDVNLMDLKYASHHSDIINIIT